MELFDDPLWNFRKTIRRLWQCMISTSDVEYMRIWKTNVFSQWICEASFHFERFFPNMPRKSSQIISLTEGGKVEIWQVLLNEEFHSCLFAKVQRSIQISVVIHEGSGGLLQLVHIRFPNLQAVAFRSSRCIIFKWYSGHYLPYVPVFSHI
jgi:hypothetical protein